MSSNIAIQVDQLGKCYRIYAKPQDRLKQSLFGRHRQYYQEFWALKHVSFTVNKGEVVGIIGRNGSGKSTLLQIIAGTLTPTTGEVRVNGRVGALLELGSGFNPEFTGRENVFLNGAILGFSRDEIARAFVAIADFAGIGTFIDQPVKTYSSGMAVRLAFAVQAIMPKEVLIVDEALAVGDELFQRKCFAKIEEFKAHGGTVLFVSHANAMVVQLCDRALLLHDGELILLGEGKQVVNLYHRFLYAPQDRHAALLSEMRQVLPLQVRSHRNISEEATEDSPGELTPPLIEGAPIPGNCPPLQAGYDASLVPVSTIHYESRGARIRDARIVTSDGQPVNVLLPRHRYRWQYRVEFDRDCEQVRCGMLIKTPSGLELGGASVALTHQGKAHVMGGTVVSVSFEFQANLAPGTYFLNAGVLGVLDGIEGYLDRKIDLGVFKVRYDENMTATALVDFHISTHLYENGK